jgi:hypothetical protein
MCPALISQLESCGALMKSADPGPYQNCAYEMLPRDRVFLIPGSNRFSSISVHAFSEMPHPTGQATAAASSGR